MIVVKPESLKEALQYLQEHPDAKIIAGGTDLLPRLNQELEYQDLILCLSDFPELTGTRREADGRVFVGAFTRLAEVENQPLLGGYPALCTAASQVASPQIRNQGTVGGNILQENRCMYFNNHVPWSQVNRCFKWGGDRCFQYKGSKQCVALFQSDVAPVLIAYRADVRLRSMEGEREIPVESLYLPAGHKAIRQDEIMLGVLLPPVQPDETSSYVRKTLRGSFDFPLLSCAVRLCASGGVIKDITVVFGSAGVKPVILEAAPEAFCGQPLDAIPALCEKWRSSISKCAAPFRDTHVNGAVRREMAVTVFNAAIREAAKHYQANK